MSNLFNNRLINDSTRLLNADEWTVYRYLCIANTKFGQLEKVQTQDCIEFSHHINALLNIIKARPVAREILEMGIPNSIEEANR